jgi:hypothetical protein
MHTYTQVFEYFIIYRDLRIKSYLQLKNKSAVNSHNELYGKKRHLAYKNLHILGNPRFNFVLTQPFFFSLFQIYLSRYVRSKTNVGGSGCLARSSYAAIFYLWLPGVSIISWMRMLNYVPS